MGFSHKCWFQPMAFPIDFRGKPWKTYRFRGENLKFRWSCDPVVAAAATAWHFMGFFLELQGTSWVILGKNEEKLHKNLS